MIIFRKPFISKNGFLNHIKSDIMMFEKLVKGEIEVTVAIIGLGYVGISLAAIFSKSHDVIGYDIDEQKIQEYQCGIDRTNEVGEQVNQLGILFTNDLSKIKRADIICITVPTPTVNGMIDDQYVRSASIQVAPYIKQGAIVVYESTVYPYFTREICLPLLEEYSGKKVGVDFSIGYSPERVNLGDPVNTIDKITKIVAGYDEKTTKRLVEFYGSVIKSIYPVQSLEIAEACKVLENSQRDLNISLTNQFAMLFEDIDTHAVMEAMNTKWNALGFTSGLVGGHCIAEDPHYLIYKSRSRGMKFTLLEEARQINDSVPRHIVTKIMELLNTKKKALSNSTIVIKGVTFKENCPDVRNSKAFDIISLLKAQGANLIVVDPIADQQDIKKYYDLEVTPFYHGASDAIIYAVAHDEFKKDRFNLDQIIIDIKGMWRHLELESYYSL